MSDFDSIERKLIASIQQALADTEQRLIAQVKEQIAMIRNDDGASITESVSVSENVSIPASEDDPAYFVTEVSELLYDDILKRVLSRAYAEKIGEDSIFTWLMNRLTCQTPSDEIVTRNLVENMVESVLEELSESTITSIAVERSIEGDSLNGLVSVLSETLFDEARGMIDGGEK